MDISYPLVWSTKNVGIIDLSLVRVGGVSEKGGAIGQVTDGDFSAVIQVSQPDSHSRPTVTVVYIGRQNLFKYQRRIWNQKKIDGNMSFPGITYSYI
jgi:hypothetical protein